MKNACITAFIIIVTRFLVVKQNSTDEIAKAKQWKRDIMKHSTILKFVNNTYFYVLFTLHYWSCFYFLNRRKAIRQAEADIWIYRIYYKQSKEKKN